MTFYQAEQLLSKVQFLDFKFKLEGDDEMSFVKIAIKSPDTADRTKMIDLIHMRPLGNIQRMYIHEFIDAILESVMSILRHEAGELFKVYDEDPFNDHYDLHLKKAKWTAIQKMFTKDAPIQRTTD